MGLFEKIFNVKAQKGEAAPEAPVRYNGEKAFVLVDIDEDDPTRGDTSGYVGLAKRIAKQTGGDFLYLDHATLAEMYPSLSKRDDRLKKLFEDRGYPDFIFSRYLSEEMQNHINNHATGLLIQSHNEFLPTAFGTYKKYSNAVVPTRLTPEMLDAEGKRFAETYQNLPRPLIGINFIDLSDEKFSEKILELQHVYKEATFFVCSTHRTPKDDHEKFVNRIKTGFGAAKGNFSIIDFDYKSSKGMEEIWNPYVGLLNQADHLLLSGFSPSMVSDALATGKSLYVSNHYKSYHDVLNNGLLKEISGHPAHMPLKTEKTAPIDMTDDMAKDIIEARKKLVKDAPKHGAVKKHSAPYRIV